MPEADGWLQLGPSRCQALEASRFRLDGGAMFGLVPRPLWSRQLPADARHRVPLACNCLLVQHGDELTLVDSGCGDRFTPGQRELYALQPHSLTTALQTSGVDAAQITRLVLTHLHFDHVSGALVDAGEGLRPSLPNAEIYVQRGEWEDALAGRSVMKSSYRPDELAALEASGRLHLLERDGPLTPYLSVFVTGGHTAHHQGVLVRDGGQTVAYPGDLVPTRAHINPYWNMAYDMFPYDTLRRKQRFLHEAVEGQWIVAWDHDPAHPWSRLKRQGQRLISVPLD